MRVIWWEASCTCVFWSQNHAQTLDWQPIPTHHVWEINPSQSLFARGYLQITERTPLYQGSMQLLKRALPVERCTQQFFCSISDVGSNCTFNHTTRVDEIGVRRHLRRVEQHEAAIRAASHSATRVAPNPLAAKWSRSASVIIIACRAPTYVPFSEDRALALRDHTAQA